MDTSTSVTGKISKNMELSIMATAPEHSLDEPIYAINWFDLKYGWLYDFYNKVVISHVLSVGGKPLLKGKFMRTLMGNNEDMRDVILVVKYPAASAFIKMVQSKIFQIKSILRVSAVLNFTFGFMKRLDITHREESKSNDYTGKLLYMVHHFKRSEKSVSIDAISAAAVQYDVFTKFGGMKCALVGQKKNNEKLRTAPFLMDGLVVFAAFEEKQFDELIQSNDYQTFINSNTSNFIGIYKRTY